MSDWQDRLREAMIEDAKKIRSRMPLRQRVAEETAAKNRERWVADQEFRETMTASFVERERSKGAEKR